jgi:protein Mpv17
MAVNPKVWVAYVGIFLTLAVSASAFDVAPAAASHAWKLYKSMLSARPLLTKSLTSSGIMTVSDAICQKVIMTDGRSSSDDRKKPRLDFSRMLQVAITGLTWSGPVTHYWYEILEKIVTIEGPLLGLIARLFLDALIFSTVTISGYFTWRSILEGSGFQGAREKLSRHFITTLLGAWKFWPAANIVNFSVVPLELRVLYSNVLSLFWTGYLTYVNSQKTTTKAE